MPKYIHEPAHQTPIRANVDILVVGGGPAGLMAAEAAAKDGAKVMLVENRGFLGGNLTTGLPVLGFLGRKGNQIIWGRPQKFIDRLRAKGLAGEHRPCPLHVSLTYISPEGAMQAALETMSESGVHVLMYVFVCDVIMDGNTIKGVIIESKAGREAILAKQVIDCTGDGDVAVRAGAEWQKGDKDGGMQPPTLMMRMKGVDIPRLRKALSTQPEIYDMDVMPPEHFAEDRGFTAVGMRDLINKARAEGIDIPVDRTIIMTGIEDDEMWINMSRVSGVDSTDPASYTHGEFVSREQNYNVVKYLKKYVPGFENSWMAQMAPFMGIRESRRIVGEYMLTADDILACHRFPDTIAVASYPIDLHHAKGGDCSLYWCEDCYDIPYRCLVPKKIDNLLLAGRDASMSHEAHGSTRVMATCMAMGEAAGVAARLAVKNDVTPRALDTNGLRSTLKSEGVYLGTE